MFEVLHDGKGAGPAGDGTYIERFGPRQKAAAEAFAKRSTAYGLPATVNESQVPRKLARRWGVL